VNWKHVKLCKKNWDNVILILGS